MSVTPVYGMPGVRAAKTATHRLAFRGGYLHDILPQGRVIDGSKSRDPSNTGDVIVLRAGLLMGKITSGGKYAPSVLGVTTNAEAVGSTSIEVSAAVATELVRRVGATGTFKLIGPGSANGVIQAETVTYSAVNTSTGAITVTAIAGNFVAGSLVCPTDGSEEPLTLIPDGFGLRVTDLDGTDVDVPFEEIPISGVVESANILPAWPSDTSLQAWIVSRLSKASGGKFTFAHAY